MIQNRRYYGKAGPYRYHSAITIKHSQVPNTSRTNFKVPFRSPIGTCTTVGADVTRSAGDKFPAWLVNGQVLINNVAYVVQTVTDGDHIVLATSAGTQASAVNWNGTPFLRHNTLCGKVQSWEGYDIVFAAAVVLGQPSTPLSFEIKNYDPRTGLLTANILVPTISHTADTTIYMFYGNPASVSSSAAPNTVWSGSLLFNPVNQWDLEAYKQPNGVYTTQAVDGYFMEEMNQIPPNVSKSGLWEMFGKVGRFRGGTWHTDVWYFNSPDGLNWNEVGECIKDVRRPTVFWNAVANQYWMYGTPDDIHINLYTSINQTNFVLDTANVLVATGSGDEINIYNIRFIADANGVPQYGWYGRFDGSSYGCSYATASSGGKAWSKVSACTFTGSLGPVSITNIVCATVIGSVIYGVNSGAPATDSVGLNSTNCYLVSSTDRINWKYEGGVSNPFICRTQSWEGEGSTGNAGTSGQVSETYFVQYNGYTWIFYLGRSRQGALPNPSGNADRMGLVKVPGTLAGLFTNTTQLGDSTSHANNPSPGSNYESQVPIIGTFGYTRKFDITFLAPPYCQTPDDASLNFANNAPFSLKVLISTPAGAGALDIVSKRDNTTINIGYDLLLKASNNTICWYLGDSAGNVDSDASTGGAGVTNVRDGNPHFIVMQRDISGGKARIYVDGANEIEITLTATDSIQPAIPMQFGVLSRTSDEKANFFNGTIEYVELTPTIDSADWVATQYNALIKPESFFSMQNPS